MSIGCFEKDARTNVKLKLKWMRDAIREAEWAAKRVLLARKKDELRKKRDAAAKAKHRKRIKKERVIRKKREAKRLKQQEQCIKVFENWKNKTPDKPFETPTGFYFLAPKGIAIRVFKRVRVYSFGGEAPRIGAATLQLLIPSDAARQCISNGNPGAKCRASRAIVEKVVGKIQALSDDDSGKYKYINYDPKSHRLAASQNRMFTYNVGEVVKPNRYDPRLVECSNGIHFFLHKHSADAYFRG